MRYSVLGVKRAFKKPIRRNYKNKMKRRLIRNIKVNRRLDLQDHSDHREKHTHLFITCRQTSCNPVLLASN